MPKKVDSKKLSLLMKKKDKEVNTRMRKTIHDMIQQQELPEALCDSLAYDEFDNGNTFKKYSSLITSWKNKRSKCRDAIKLYQDIVDGIQGKRQWKGISKSKSKSKSKGAAGSVGGCNKRLRSKTRSNRKPRRKTKLRR